MSVFEAVDALAKSNEEEMNYGECKENIEMLAVARDTVDCSICL